MSGLCVGKSWLFDSTDLGDHDQARKLCIACPALSECSERARRLNRASQVAQMTGTWAGRLYGRGKGPEHQARIETEDAMFTDAEAREAHARYVAGDRNDRARIGERVYSRRARRRRKAAA